MHIKCYRYKSTFNHLILHRIYCFHSINLYQANSCHKIKPAIETTDFHMELLYSNIAKLNCNLYFAISY